MNLTAKAVAALQLPTGKTDHIEWDDALRGFGYRLRAGAGNKVLRSWVAQYRRAGGSRRITIGAAGVVSAEQARKEAKKVLGRVAIGEDPQADRRERRDKDRHTLRSVAVEYLRAKKSELRPRSYVEAERYLTGKYFKPLHALAINAVSRADVSSRILTIAREAGNTTANRARSNLNALYSWSLRMGLTDSNPVNFSVQPKESEGRTRVLSNAELAAVWRASSDDRDDYSRIVRLLILTACRRQEVGGMRWREFDSERGVWTIPAERSKNKHSHALPLPEAAWQIVRSVPHLAHGDQLFSIRGAQGFGRWAEGKAALDRRLGDAMMEPWTLHDIRRSVATKMADMGIQPHIIEQILNHQSGHKSGVAGIYNRSSYEREVKTALATWADHVRVLAEGGERKVFPMQSATAS